MNDTKEALDNITSLDLEAREKELIRINEELDQKRKEISQRADNLLVKFIFCVKTKDKKIRIKS